MSDELECFRKAAELGCKDFVITDTIYLRGTEACSCLELPYPVRQGYDEAHAQRINRYAAAVCEIWWRERQELFLQAHNYAKDWTRELILDASEMERRLLMARAFGRKDGGA